jgi:hypothetical protein
MSVFRRSRAIGSSSWATLSMWKISFRSISSRVKISRPKKLRNGKTSCADKKLNDLNLKYVKGFVDKYPNISGILSLDYNFVNKRHDKYFIQFQMMIEMRNWMIFTYISTNTY